VAVQQRPGDLENVSKGSSHTVSLTPPGDLEQRLEVRTVDHAGNISPWRAYPFYVRPQPADAGYWKFDEGSGDTAGSASGGSEFAGVLQGGAAWAASGLNPNDPAASGTAISLNGTGAYVEMPPVLATNHAAGFSVSAWVEPVDLSSNRTVVSQIGENVFAFRLYYSRTWDSWCFSVHDADSTGSTITAVCSSQTPQSGVWTHLVGVYDRPAGRLRLWVNGGPNNGPAAPAGTVDEVDAPAMWAATGSFRVGRARNGEYFAGLVDEVRAYQRVVPEVEVVHMFRQCLEATCPPMPTPEALTLVGAWDFEETSGSVAADSSGMNNPATRQGGAEWTAFGYDGTRGVSLDGQSGYLATDGHVLLTDQSFTVSAWARLAQIPSGDRAVVAQFGQQISAFRPQYRASTGQWCMTGRLVDDPGSGSPPSRWTASPRSVRVTAAARCSPRDSARRSPAA
jgi:hypothetical protein